MKAPLTHSHSHSHSHYPANIVSPSLPIPSSISDPQIPHVIDANQATLSAFRCAAGAGFTLTRL